MGGKKFYAVWNENGHSPTKAHKTKNEAIAEAERLILGSGGRFFILEVIGIVGRQEMPVEYIEIKD